MRYLISKPGVTVAKVYALVNDNGIFWIINPKKATDFSLAKARKLAKAFKKEQASVEEMCYEKIFT